MIIDFDTVTLRLLSLSLDAAALKQQVVANNIANINSVGYIPKTVTFEQYLQEAATANNADKVELSDSQMDDIKQKFEAGEFVEDADADKVELDSEMVELTQNVIRYQSLIHVMKARGLTSLAINEGRT